MRTLKVVLAVLLAVPAWTSFAPRAQGQQRGVTVEGKKWALLVAANAFADKRLGRLSHCGDDVEDLKKFLVREAGFPENQVIVLRDKPGEIRELPLRRVIEQTLDAFVTLPGPDDQVVVAFSLHGVEVRGTPYLCPIDADPDKPEATMLPVAWLYKTLETRCRAAQKIVILDACRKSVQTQDRGVVVEQKPMSQLFAEGIRQVPKGLVVLLSCGSGQVSYEDPGLRRGVFMNFILEGLAGRADERGLGRQGNGDGLVDVNELFQYANAETKAFVLKEYNDAQIPEIEMRGTNGVLTAARVNSTDSRRPIDPGIERALSLPTEETELLGLIVALAKITARQAGTGEMHLAQVGFKRALQLTEQIEEDFLKDYAHEEISRAQAELKSFVPAVNTAKLMKDEARQGRILDHIAKAQADAKGFAGAVKTTQLITDKPSQAATLDYIEKACTHSNAGVETAQGATDKATQEKTLGNIARARADAGDFDGADTTVRVMASKVTKASPVTASLMLQVAGTLDYIARARADAEDFAGAIRTANSILYLENRMAGTHSGNRYRYSRTQLFALEYVASAATDAEQLDWAEVAVSRIEAILEILKGQYITHRDKSEEAQLEAILKNAKARLEARRKKP